MNTAGGFLAFCLMAVFVLNPLTAGITGLGSMLTALARPKNLLALSIMVAVFSFCGCVILFPVDTILTGEMQSMPIRGIIFAMAVLGIYYLFSKLLKSASPALYEKYGAMLSPAALNGVALGAPLVVSYYAGFVAQQPSDIGLLLEEATPVTDFALSLGVGLGAGIGFAIASFLVCEGMRRADNPDLPECFRGAPIMIIYIGLLSLAFWGIGGGIPLLPF